MHKKIIIIRADSFFPEQVSQLINGLRKNFSLKIHEPIFPARYLLHIPFVRIIEHRGVKPRQLKSLARIVDSVKIGK